MRPSRASLRIAMATTLLSAATAIPAFAQAQTQDAFFDGSVLQEIRMFVNARDWQALRTNFNEDTYYPANFTWNGMTVRNVGIKSHGSGTRNGVKPSLRVDINRYLNSQLFLGLKAFYLKNEYTDPSLLHERISMQMFTQMGLPAPREAHARLYVNNEYLGTYLIVESVDETFLTRVFGTVNGQRMDDGYLFKYEWVTNYDFSYLGPALEAYAPMFIPQTRETDALVQIFYPLEELIRAANESSDDRFASAVGAYLDVPLFMKYLAVENYMSEVDGFVGDWAMNNFDLYRFRQASTAQLVPWDKDHSFFTLDHPIDYNLDTNVLVRRTMSVPELRQAYLDALMQCATIAMQTEGDDTRGWMEREVDRDAAQIQAAVSEDPGYPFPLDLFNTEVAYLVDFARDRASVVTCEVANAENSSDPPVECPSYGESSRTR